MSRTPFDASREAMGLLETTGLTPAIVAVDQMEKAAPIRVLECELNDYYGVVVKIAGRVDAVLSALEAAHTIAAAMGGEPVISILSRPEPRAAAAIRSPRQFNPLIEQDTVFVPETDDKRQLLQRKDQPAMAETSTALGFIETQGFTAVFDAIDTACKAANVEIVGKEKLGGGYITVVIRGDVAAVHAGIEAARQRVEGLGKLIAAHVIARPSPTVLPLLPKLSM